MKSFFLLASVVMAAIWLWWWISGLFLLDMPIDDIKLYQIRREIPLIEALLFYIAYRVTPETKK